MQICMQHVLPFLPLGSEPLTPTPRQQQLLERPRLFDGQPLNGASHMTRAVALQQPRGWAKEEVPLSDRGAQRQTNYRLLEQSHVPRSLQGSNI